jgi:two-component system LytT family response regulator
VPERAIRTLIVDDEPLAREGLRLLLRGDPECELVGECGSGREALAAIRRLHPDLVFLDVQMPEQNGFEVLAALAPAERPAVVFVTAYDKYALRAFEVHALDYLLKPFDDQRFAEALGRAKKELRMAEVSVLSKRLLTLLEQYGGAEHGNGNGNAVGDGDKPPGYVDRIAIKEIGRVVFLDVAEIDWIEAADYYVQLHVGKRSYLHRESMNHLEGRLDPEHFVRIHRSAIVNRGRVVELRSGGRRDLTVVLSGGAQLKVARRHRDKLQKLR